MIKRTPKSNHLLQLVIGIVFLSSWFYVIHFEGLRFSELFSSKNITYGSAFLGKLLGVNESKPAYIDVSSWQELAKPFLDTLWMGVLAIGISISGLFITMFFAAKNIANGKLTLRKSWFRSLFGSFVRLSYLITRAIPELLWAMILVIVLKPGILPGALALAIHNFGILGKLTAEAIEDIDSKPAHSVVTSGGNTFQVLFYVVLPTIYPRLMSYIVYRFEVVMRSTIVVGFIGAGGLGMNFKLAMSYFRYSEVTLIIILYFILVLFADALSHTTRKFIKE